MYVVRCFLLDTFCFYLGGANAKELLWFHLMSKCNCCHCHTNTAQHTLELNKKMHLCETVISRLRWFATSTGNSVRCVFPFADFAWHTNTLAVCSRLFVLFLRKLRNSWLRRTIRENNALSVWMELRIADKNKSSCERCQYSIRCKEINSRIAHTNIAH